ncbi:MAG: PP2C family protein-serine/threonine phosphatase [Christensenella sp.]
MNKSKFWKNILIVLAVAVLFYLLSLPQVHIVIDESHVQLRLSGFLPMTAGLLFGPVGAFGCALGNFFNDLSGTLDFADLFGSCGVFLMAWLPYKLWHSSFFFKERKLEFLHSAGSVVKFVLIAAVASVCAAAVAAIGGEITYTFGFDVFFLQVMLQYFDLTMMFGLLLVHIGIQKAHIAPAIPKGVYEKDYARARYVIDYVLMAVAVALAFLLLGGNYLFELSGAFYQAVYLTELGVIAALAFLPMTRGEQLSKRAPTPYRPISGLQGQIITVFSVLLCILLVLCGVFSAWLIYEDINIAATAMDILMIEANTVALVWSRIFTSMAIEAAVLVGLLTLLLRRVDTLLIQPLKKTSDYANRFVTGDRLVETKLQLKPTGNEIDTLGRSIDRMAEDIRGYAEEIRCKAQAEQKLAAEMSAARDIQMGMLPAKWTGTGFELAARICPARQVGGDFYGFRQLDRESVFAAVADVTGKGVSAALFMACASTLMEARLHLPLAELMGQVIEELAKKNDSMLFVTMFACVVDKAAGVLRYVNAGHNPPVIYANGCAKLLEDEPDFVLGPMAGTPYEEKTLPLTEDFALLMYTDGVVEAENDAHAFFGTERLLTCTQELFERGYAAQTVADGVAKAVEDFAAGAEQTDDITILCMIPKEET